MYTVTVYTFMGVFSTSLARCQFRSYDPVWYRELLRRSDQFQFDNSDQIKAVLADLISKEPPEKSQTRFHFFVDDSLQLVDLRIGHPDAEGAWSLETVDSLANDEKRALLDAIGEEKIAATSLATALVRHGGIESIRCNLSAVAWRIWEAVSSFENGFHSPTIPDEEMNAWLSIFCPIRLQCFAPQTFREKPRIQILRSKNGVQDISGVVKNIQYSVAVASLAAQQIQEIAPLVPKSILMRLQQVRSAFNALFLLCDDERLNDAFLDYIVGQTYDDFTVDDPWGDKDL